VKSVADRGFIFSSESVLAILRGDKTQTRRVVKRENAPDPGHVWRPCLCRELDPSDTPCDVCTARFGVPYAVAGDVIWVREALFIGDAGGWCYEADRAPIALSPRDTSIPAVLSWAHHQEKERCSARHMPKFAARVRRTVLSVRAEPLQSISTVDAMDEGVMPMIVAGGTISYTHGFRVAWDSINGKRAPWSSDPWVWRYEFARNTAGG
jgi:hypothetical protein